MSAYRDGKRQDGRVRLGVFLTPGIIGKLKREAAKRTKGRGLGAMSTQRVTASQVAAEAIEWAYR